MVAAVGLLAIAALTCGGVAALVHGDDTGVTHRPGRHSDWERWAQPRARTILGPAEALEHRVRAVEREAAEARDALTRARRAGFEPGLVESLEARIDRLGLGDDLGRERGHEQGRPAKARPAHVRPLDTRTRDL